MLLTLYNKTNLGSIEQMKNILILLMVLPILAFTSIPQDNEIQFQILRNGNPFGDHTIKFSKTADDKTKVDIHINMSVTAGPISFFEYNHNNTEIWDGNRLVSLSSETNDDGDQYFVNAKWKDSILDIQSSSKNQKLLSPIFSTSYWNFNTVNQSRLLNSQKGTLDTIEIIGKIQDNIKINKINYLTNRYTLRINGDREIKIWYDITTKEWMGLDFTIQGQHISYKRRNPL